MSWLERIRETVEIEPERAEKVFIKRSGRRAENQVKKALIRLKRKKKILYFVQSEKFSPEDKRGIDFKIRTLKGKEILLQIKSFLPPEKIKAWGLKKITPRIWKKKGIYYLEARRKEKLGQLIAKIQRILEIEK